MDDTTKSRCRGRLSESPEKAAGAPEIEITPEMIEAGREYLYARAVDRFSTSLVDDEFIAGFGRSLIEASSRSTSAAVFETPSQVPSRHQSKREARVHRR